MKVIKKGKIIKSSENDKSFDGESAVGWDITIAQEDGMQGFYIYYTNSKYKDRGYDGWNLTLDEVDSQLKFEEDRWGWVIEWQD